MPPEPAMRVKSHRRSLYQKVKTFRNCARKKARKAAMSGLRCDHIVSHQTSQMGAVLHTPACRFVQSLSNGSAPSSLTQGTVILVSQ